MIRVLVVEDEPPARTRLTRLVKEMAVDVHIVASIGSLAEFHEILTSGAEIDLALVDVQLSDGVSLDVLSRIDATFPVIFTTAYDQFVLKAFEHQGIAYLLKPIRREDLRKAWDKYVTLEHHFVKKPDDVPSFRERLVLRKGRDHHNLAVSEIAVFKSVHKIVFAITDNREQYIIDMPLSTIELELDPSRYFRLSRQVIARIDVIQRFRQDAKGRCYVTLNTPVEETVVVSQERTAQFKAWLDR